MSCSRPCAIVRVCVCVSPFPPVAALYSSVPDNVVTVHARPYETATTQAAKAVTLPLSLPFTVSMRTREARVRLQICKTARRTAVTTRTHSSSPSHPSSIPYLLI